MATGAWGDNVSWEWIQVDGASSNTAVDDGVTLTDATSARASFAAPANEFLSLYGTEDQCFDALSQWRWPNGFVCPHCGHDRCCQSSTRKLQQCNHCHRQTSITAGTLFEATKLPLTVWFQAIYFMTQDKKGGSAMKLHRHLGISYNAAWRMRHKLMQVMMERDREYTLTGQVQLDDAYLGGERSLPDIIPRLVYVALRTPPMLERLLKLSLV